MNKIIFTIACLTALSLTLPRAARADDSDADDAQAIQSCLKKWKHHPFGAKPSYRTLGAKVKVMGIGSDVIDVEKTAKPELVLVKTGVSVMAKTLYNLGNPNGWYCLKGRVAVMGKIQIDLNCKATLATSGDDVAVLGSSDDKSGGTAVMGSVHVNRQCK